MKKKFTHSKIILYLMLIMLVNACAQGYKDDYTFDPGVKNTTLESPKPEGFKILATPDGARVRIAWPVVYGAGGYEATLYIIDDPENHVVVGELNQFVDGCYFERPLQEDTKYLVEVRTLGNAEYNNKEALSFSQLKFTTLVEATTIPDGTDLYTYFTENPIPSIDPVDGKVSDQVVAYELAPGGSYTMSGNVKNGLSNVIIRGDKTHHAKMTMSSGAFLSDGGGVKLQFIDFDCAAFTGTAFVTLNPLSSANAAVTSAKGFVMVPFVKFQSCNIADLPKMLLNDKSAKYGIQNVLIKDCVISQNATNIIFIRMQGGLVKDLDINNSTIYYKLPSNTYFIQYTSVKVGDDPAWNWATGSISVTNSTFYNVSYTGQFGNYGGMTQKYCSFTMQKTILVNCGNGEVIRRFGAGSANPSVSFGYNTYWYNNAFAANELTTTPKDASGTHFTTNPDLKDPANGDFTVQGAAQIEARTGDPRWLP